MLLIRCDANTDIGAGHFVRELALAEAAIDCGIPVAMVMHQPAQNFRDLAAASDVELVALESTPNSASDAGELRHLALQREATAVVIDGYQFTTDYYQVLGDEEYTLAAVDDIAHQHFPVDILVNVNPHAAELNYDVPDDTEMLLGVDYALLRRQFRRARAELDAQGGPEIPEQISRVLITMGGGDPTNETAKALKALQRAEFTAQVDVVIGPANPHRRELEGLADRINAEIRFDTNVSNMAQLMSGQHLAICAAGGTSWELACLGIPMMQIVIADNQREIVRWLRDRSMSIQLGWYEDVTSDSASTAIRRLNTKESKRQEMVDQSMDIIDGQGAERVVNYLKASASR